MKFQGALDMFLDYLNHLKKDDVLSLSFIKDKDLPKLVR